MEPKKEIQWKNEINDERKRLRKRMLQTWKDKIAKGVNTKSGRQTVRGTQIDRRID